MTAPGFLFDENTAHRSIRRLLYERNASISCWVIGEWEAPPIGSPDPDLLIWAEENQCVSVTHNHGTMPVHLREHLEAGRQAHPWYLGSEDRLSGLEDC